MRQPDDFLPTTLPSSPRQSRIQQTVNCIGENGRFDGSLLAHITFGSSPIAAVPGVFPCELKPLHSTNAEEHWFVGQPRIETGIEGSVSWSSSNEFLFSAISRRLLPATEVTELTQVLYQELLDFVHRRPQNQLLRFWNFIPQINSGAGDQEIYKLFCTGRLNAFERSGLSAEEFPAASAVGHHGEYLTVQLLSAVGEGKHLGNDHQVDAFKYPRQYGVTSPSFARATLFPSGDKQVLFISGTASILGHETQHPEDVEQQTKTTLVNIDRLLAQTDKRLECVACARVYVRHVTDLPRISAILEAQLPNAKFVYVQADICRSDLLVEVECFCT